jgi:Protein of unknown function (DUF3987)
MGTTQPGRIAEYIHGVHAGGDRDDGLIQRFSFSVWPDEPPSWTDIDRYPLTQARETAWKVFERMDELDPAALGAVKGDYDSVPSLRLDDAAQGKFREWRKDLEARLRSGDMSPALEGHLAKYRKLVPTLALINHAVDRGHRAVGLPSILRALALAEFLEKHARRIYGAGGEIETAAATAILARIRRGDLKNGFGARDIQRRDWSKLTDGEHIKAGLSLLCDLHYIAVVQIASGPAGGRPTVAYAINPRAVL